ncbi:MAG: hypothetical protein QOG94_876 [Solirubrobacteraceae bacterium]|jgi:hypothetical protein|nr:hypothetical protein [Solirubrobacteraceae bacterium]MEA2137117.1 hypothetical protein [Solirubrobacteraceae bacterium]
MAFEVGQRVIAEKSGRRRRTARAPMRPPRHGVVEKVLRGDPNPRYEIRWDEGIVTVFSPMHGGLAADPAHPLVGADEAVEDEPAGATT